MVSLFQCLRNDHALAGGKPVIFQHNRERPLAHIFECLIIVFESTVCRSGNIVFGHQLLGEILA